MRSVVELRRNQADGPVATEASEVFGATGAEAGVGADSPPGFSSRILRGGSEAPSQCGWRCVWVGGKFVINRRFVGQLSHPFLGSELMVLFTPPRSFEQLEQLHRDR